MASILKGQSGQPIQFETKPNVNGDDVLTRPDIVGTVSESGGTPTGAIIQRGSNANGEFVRYADGTQICTQTLDLGSRVSFGNGTFADPYRSQSSGWTFPVAFAENPTFTASGIITSVASVRQNSVAAASLNQTNIEFIQASMLTSNSTDIGVTVQCQAIGRWY